MIKTTLTRFGWLIFVLLSALCRAESDGAIVDYTSAPVVYPSGLPFSELVVVDNTIYLAGMIAVKPGTLELVDGGMASEARQVMDNIKTVLSASGFTLNNVVKCTVMLADIAEWGAFNTVYKGFFSKAPYPVRSALGVNGLALGARVEVECIGAVMPVS